MAKGKSSKHLSIIIKILIIIVSIIFILLCPFGFIFVLLSLLPSITAIFIDKRINRCASSTLCSFNLIGIMPHLFTAWNSADFNLSCKDYLTNIYIWFSTYGSTTIGCFLIWIIPQFTAKLFRTRAEFKVKTIDNDQAQLIEEWGESLITKVNSLTNR